MYDGRQAKTTLICLWRQTKKSVRKVDVPFAHFQRHDEFEFSDDVMHIQ